MKTSLKHFFAEVNELRANGQITVDGKDVKLNFFLGGDMKFLLKIMDVNPATADNACLWCKIHKDNRWDTSKVPNYYNQTVPSTNEHWRKSRSFVNARKTIMGT